MVWAIADLYAEEEHFCAFDVARKGKCMNGGGHKEAVVEFDPFFELLVEIDEGDALGDVPAEPLRVGLCVSVGKLVGVDDVVVAPYFVFLSRIRCVRCQ